jgi:hypothetical protein
LKPAIARSVHEGAPPVKARVREEILAIALQVIVYPTLSVRGPDTRYVLQYGTSYSSCIHFEASNWVLERKQCEQDPIQPRVMRLPDMYIVLSGPFGLLYVDVLASICGALRLIPTCLL